MEISYVSYCETVSRLTVRMLYWLCSVVKDFLIRSIPNLDNTNSAKTRQTAPLYFRHVF